MDQFRELVSQRLRDGVRQVVPDTLQQMFPPREAGADTRARTFLSFAHTCVLMGKWHASAHGYKCLWRFKRAPSSFTAALISADKDDFLQINQECKDVCSRHQIPDGSRVQSQRPLLIAVVLHGGRSQQTDGVNAGILWPYVKQTHPLKRNGSQVWCQELRLSTTLLLWICHLSEAARSRLLS